VVRPHSLGEEYETRKKTASGVAKSWPSKKKMGGRIKGKTLDRRPEIEGHRTILTLMGGSNRKGTKVALRGDCQETLP